MNEPVKPHNFLDDLATLENYLSAAQDVLKSGFMPDITSLEGRVATICKNIQQASKPIQHECLPRLHSFLDHLNKLDHEMRAFQQSRIRTEGNG